jgi:hypothetical protein
MADQTSRGGKKQGHERDPQGKQHQGAHTKPGPAGDPPSGPEAELKQRRHEEHTRGQDEKA